VIVDCAIHGRVTVPNLIGGTSTFTFESSYANCPLCGRMSPILDGTYEVVNSVLRAFTEAGATKEEVSRFHAIAEAVQSGTATPEEAEQQIAQLGSAFLNIWKWLNANGTAIQTIVAILALFLMFHFEQGSRADTAKLQEATEKQIAVTQSVELVQRQILEELRKQTVLAQPEPPSPPPKRLKTEIDQPQTEVTGEHVSRQQRRRREQKARKERTRPRP
jgi:type IV secretory pathway VirB10-like protein